jgi:hypothetical protein
MSQTVSQRKPGLRDERPGLFVCRCRPLGPAPGGRDPPNAIFNNSEPLPSPLGMGARAPVAKLADAAARAAAAFTGMQVRFLPGAPEDLARSVVCYGASRGGRCGLSASGELRRLRPKTAEAPRHHGTRPSPGATPSQPDQAKATTPDRACRWARADNEIIGTGLPVRRQAWIVGSTGTTGECPSGRRDLPLKQGFAGSNPASPTRLFPNERDSDAETDRCLREPEPCARGGNFGIRAGLRSRWPQGHVSSTLTARTRATWPL